MKWAYTPFFLFVAVFIGAALVGYSKYLRNRHFIILLAISVSWVVGLLLIAPFQRFISNGNPWIEGSLAVSGIAAPVGLTGWSLGYLCREFGSRLRSRGRLRTRRHRSPQK